MALDGSGNTLLRLMPTLPPSTSSPSATPPSAQFRNHRRQLRQTKRQPAGRRGEQDRQCHALLFPLPTSSGLITLSVSSNFLATTPPPAPRPAPVPRPHTRWPRGKLLHRARFCAHSLRRHQRQRGAYRYQSQCAAHGIYNADPHQSLRHCRIPRWTATCVHYF